MSDLPSKAELDEMEQRLRYGDFLLPSMGQRAVNAARQLRERLERIDELLPTDMIAQDLNPSHEDYEPERDIVIRLTHTEARSLLAAMKKD